jgi:pyruvate kinase
MTSLDEISACACNTAVKEGLAVEGDMIVVTAGTPTGVAGRTNTIKILTV